MEDTGFWILKRACVDFCVADSPALFEYWFSGSNFKSKRIFCYELVTMSSFISLNYVHKSSLVAFAYYVNVD